MTAHSLFWWEEAEEIDLAEIERAEAAERDARARHRTEVERAAMDVQRANAAYDVALRKYRCAPDGMIRSRRSDLRMANAGILRAELRLAELAKERPDWE